MSTGIGADNTTFGCINSHYFDVTKPAQDGGKGVWRTKQAGRTGIGTVMRDKRIRPSSCWPTIPTAKTPTAPPTGKRPRMPARRLHKMVKEVDPHSLKMSRKGSAGLITFMNKEEYQSLPVNNFQGGSDPRAPQICGKFYAENLFEHRGMDGCFPGCNLQCTKGGWVTLVSGDHIGRRRSGSTVPNTKPPPASAPISASGTPEFIMEANWHCDNYGIDTITTATIMAFLMECFQRGYLTTEDADGLELTWGNEAAALTFIHRLAHGETELAQAAGKGMLRTGRLGGGTLPGAAAGIDARSRAGALRHADQGAALLLLPDPPLALHAGLLCRRQRHRRPSRRRLADQGRPAGRLPDLRGQGQGTDDLSAGPARQ